MVNTHRGVTISLTLPCAVTKSTRGEGAAVVLGAPDDGAFGRGDEHGAARAAGQADLGLVVGADDGGVDVAPVVELHAAQKRHVQPAAHAQVEHLHQRKARAGRLPQLPARAGKLAQRRLDGVHPAGDVEVHGVGRVQALGQQRGDHGHVRGHAVKDRIAVMDEARHGHRHHIAGTDHSRLPPSERKRSSASASLSSRNARISAPSGS